MIRSAVASRRIFLVGAASSLGAAVLSACGSSSSSRTAGNAGVPAGGSSVQATTADTQENLSGELLWQHYRSAGPQPSAGSTAAPTGNPASLQSKATDVPVPTEYDYMRDEDTSGLRFTFAYYIAALNYARATGDMKPALKVVHPQNQPAIAQLQGYEQLYMSATQWIVGGSWTVSLTEKQPDEKGYKYAWACSVKQESGVLVNAAANTNTALPTEEARAMRKLYGMWEGEQWWIISAEQYDPSASPRRTALPQVTPTVPAKVVTVPASH